MSRLAVGIDLGAAYTKALLLGEDGRVLARHREKTGYQPDHAARQALAAVLADASCRADHLCAIVSTGFARRLIKEHTMAVTELTAAMRGARLLFPETRTVLDLGGQTIKVCRCDPFGRIQAFRLNDKCASGTGAFLERTARIMNQPLENLDRLIAESRHPAPISSVCAVFAESEIINQLVQAVAPADILHGAMQACVDRAVQIALRVGVEPQLCLTGGLLQFGSAAKLLRARLGDEARIPEAGMVPYLAALGAAQIGICFGEHQEATGVT